MFLKLLIGATLLVNAISCHKKLRGSLTNNDIESARKLFATEADGTPTAPTTPGAADADSSTATSAAGRNSPVRQNCPDWLLEYAAFHKQMRGNPDAKYLVHSIEPKGSRSGLGDRMRGMMFTARLAVSLQRVVLFTWQNEPHEPDWFLPPAGDIDWKLEGVEGYQPPLPRKLSKHFQGSEAFVELKGRLEPPDCSPSADSACFRAYSHRPEQRSTAKWIQNGGLTHHNASKFITLLTAQNADAVCEGCPSLDMPPGREAISSSTAEAGGASNAGRHSTNMDNPAACLFNHLFKPSDELQAAADQHLLQLFGPRALQPDFKYVGMHLRLGGTEGEKTLPQSKGSGLGDLADFLGGMQCADELGMQAGINTSTVPVLLITDNHRLRNFIKAGRLRQAVTPDVTPTHMAKMKGREQLDKAAAMSSYIDLELLARSTCFVASASGFSNTAWLLGRGKPCVADLKQTVYAKWRKHNPCRIE